MRKIYALAFMLFSLLAITQNVLAQCGTTPITGDLIITANTGMSGTYNISGLFRVEPGVVCSVSPYTGGGCGELVINAAQIEILGDIIADGAGYPGGTGGAGGSAGNNAGALNNCIDKDNCLVIDVDGGAVGAAGSGPGAGISGNAGTQGMGPKQVCQNFGDEYGFVGGAGGAGAAAGASYGGNAAIGGAGGAGSAYNAANFSGMDLAGCASPAAGGGGTGGAVAATYGTANGTDIALGSGGAGAGGGGKSSANGGAGGVGGAGGGMVTLNSSGSLSVQGTISVNGFTGGVGGGGGAGGITDHCCSPLEPCNGCDERTFSSGAGGGGGSGGGSGGGIFLKAFGPADIAGTLRSIGANGGIGGSGGNGHPGCTYSGGILCGNNSGSTNAGASGELGGAASGGRIKIFQNPCQTNTINASVLINGGNGNGGQAADGTYFLGDIGTITAGTLSSTTDSVSCYGLSDGSGEVTITGGTAPFTYDWSPIGGNASTATGLPAGTYVVTVADSNNCEVTANVVIEEPDTLTAQIFGVIGADCYGVSTGEASVMGLGGTEPYSYSWNDPGLQITATATGLPAGQWVAEVTDIHGCTDTAIVTLGQPLPFAATVAIDNDVSCFGGTDGQATVTASGTSLTYQWDDPLLQQNATATNLPAGSWTVTIASSQTCDTVVTVVINQPDSLVLIAVENQSVSCNGGNDGIADVAVLGGTGPFDYQWDDSNLTQTAQVGGLAAGTYNVVVTDANLCTATASVVITEATSMSIALSIDSADCNGAATGAIEAIVSGGTGGYDYLWNPGAITGNPLTGVAAGTYSVLVTDDNGCEEEFLNILVQEPTAIVPTLVQQEDVSCFGAADGQAEISALGGTPGYTYLWDDPTAQNTALAGGLVPGTYSVTITDVNGCTVQWLNINVTEPDELLVTVTSATPITCDEGTDGMAETSVTGGTLSYNYLWDDPSGQSGGTAIDLGEGTYTVTVTDANGCIAQATAVIDPPVNVLTADFTLSPDSGLQPLDITVFNNSEGGTAYEWVFGDGNEMTTYDTASFQYLYADSGSFDVTLIAYNDVTGCTDTLMLENGIYIVPTSHITIPNVITPNGDGFNDVFPVDPVQNDFFPFQIRNIYDFHGEVYNRWGEKVYEWNLPLGGWDGRTTSGIELGAGTYFYTITAKGVDGDAVTDYEFNGDITLIR